MRAPNSNAVGRLASWLAPLMLLTLAGCLLPQPDTPPIGPPNATGRVSAPDVKRPSSDTALATPAPAPSPAAPMATMVPATPSGLPNGAAAERVTGLLEGRITGATATRVTAVAQAAGQPGALVRPEGDGTFTLALAPGRYTLELTTADGVLVATPAIEVKAAEPTRVTVTVSADGKAATIEPVP